MTYIDAVGSQLLETGLDRLNGLLSGIVAMFLGILDLCGQSEAPLLPTNLTSPGLLLAADIDTCCVYLAVSSSLEDIKGLGKCFRVTDACVELLTAGRPKGH